MRFLSVLLHSTGYFNNTESTQQITITKPDREELSPRTTVRHVHSRYDDPYHHYRHALLECKMPDSQSTQMLRQKGSSSVNKLLQDILYLQ